MIRIFGAENQIKRSIIVNWKTQLAETGDEYLIGLTNKGTVKRAYKDKESACVKIMETAEEAILQVDGETVTLRIPLGESKCTCPSRSICRHIILGILVLKESLSDNAEVLSEEERSPDSDEKNAAAEFSDNTSPEQDKAAESPEDSSETKMKTSDTAGAAGSSMQEQLWKEILSYPEKALCRTMGARHLASFLNKADSNIRPEIEESSVFTIRLPGQNTTVKLLSPLEYSSCTCHKKELCIHKAEAILWCKLKAGALSLKDLDEARKKEIPVDPKQVKDAASQMKDYLEELMATGLSRVSPDVTDSLERFAIISHNAGLADLERAFRGLGTLYQSYLSRQASFLTADLMKKLTGLYSGVNILLETEDITLLAKEAGTFHADYLSAGNLNLIGITMEHFKDAAGYEGETVYFLETDSNRWYTYTVARPVFYDQRKKWGKPQKSEAPWGLACSLENLIMLRIHLNNAKCDERRRLSSSKETKGEILGNFQPDPEAVPGWYYEDFGKLFSEQITKQMHISAAPVPESAMQPAVDELPETEQSVWGRDLVLIQPAFCEKAVFSETDQMLLMSLYDREKREIILELAYSKEEAKNIRYLEKIKEDSPPCFIGKIYLRDGRIRLIPVDTWRCSD